jgi:mannose-6-phosphate isomerase-like protein (cupin superfamily)
MDSIAHIDSIDYVLHDHSAVSPGPVGSASHPWYMHLHQDDNLLVLHGRREVDIYNKTHGKFLYNGGDILVWPAGVFHRIVSGEDGRISLDSRRTQGLGVIISRK